MIFKKKKNELNKEFADLIEKAFISLLQTKDFKEISVTDICNITGLHKNIFYANYLDTKELADKIRYDLEKGFGEPFRNSDEEHTENKLLMILNSIYENQLIYKTYIKLGYRVSQQIYINDLTDTTKEMNDSRMAYHMEYFRHGLDAIVNKWLEDDCIEKPEEIEEIIKAEYIGK